MKPAAQSTQKRKAAKVHSAVAEVKPLNAACHTPSSLVIPNKRLKVRFDLFLSNSCVAADLKKKEKKKEWFKLFFCVIFSGAVTNLSDRCSVQNSAGALQHRGYSNGAYELP